MIFQLQNIVFVGAVVHMSGTFWYLYNTVRGQNKPNRVTFLMWAVAPLIGTAAAISDGVGWAILPTFLAGLGPFLIFCASFVNKKAYWQLSIFDYWCGGLSVAALVLWGLMADPLLAIIFAVISDGAAAIPTMIKSYKFPDTETGISYVTSGFSALTGFFAVKNGAPAEYIFGAWIIIANIIILFSLYHKKIFKNL